MRTIGVLLAALALRLFALPPAPTTYVTDAAGVLDDAREQALNERLARYDRETTNQLLVYVDRSVPPDTTLEELGAQAIRTWAPGTVRKDNGAILFLFVDSRQSRIEVGYGLEGVLTDARSKRILVSLRPALQRGDYTGAVEAGVSRIVRTIGDPASADPPPPRGLIHLSADQARIVGPALFFGVAAIVFGGMAVFLFVLFRLVLRNYRETGRWFPRSSGSSWSSGGSSSSSSSSSSSYRGGGGSGGGGGASDRW